MQDDHSQFEMSSLIVIVETFMAFIVAGSIDKAVELLANDFVYIFHIAETAAPYAGASEGKEAMRMTLHKIEQDFERILFHTTTLPSTDSTVRQRLEFIMRHRASNERLQGIGRFVWTVRDGMIVRCEEYHDAPMLEAFFRLFGSGGPKPDGPPE
jgi:ketosteroid isomerase-like protein